MVVPEITLRMGAVRVRERQAGQTRCSILCILFCLALCLIPVHAAAQVVVSQVYAAGGTASSKYKNDFVELFNRGTALVNLTGWAVGYKQQSTTSDWLRTPLEGSIPPGGYYLVKLSGSALGSLPLPAEDEAGFTNLESSGSVAVFGPDGIIPQDLVGYGNSPPHFDGAPVPSVLSGGDVAILRLSGGCRDSNNNSLDFSVDAPFPFNSGSPLNSCACTFRLPLTSEAIPAAGATRSFDVIQETGQPCAWGPQTTASFVHITAFTGTDSGTVSYSVDSNPFLDARQATITVADQTFTITQAGGAPVVDAAPPFGLIDTPLHGSTGLSGSVAFTGWALDDAGVTAVRIFRDPVAPEEPGKQVFVGSAVLVEGARPDVAAQFPTYPNRTRAGWGYLMLTNMLPNRGDGVFTFYVYADDASGRSRLLPLAADGTTTSITITCANSAAINPFGAIDTPKQGQTVSGIVDNFGWVLSRRPARADPPSGGVVTVFIDGVPVGVPGGWTDRSDLTPLFPAADYPGIGSALGVLTFDTRALSNGVHTIAWGVTDNNGKSEGIGSRYFSVSNATTGTPARAASPLHGEGTASSAEPRNSLLHTALFGRRGFDLNAPLEVFSPDPDGHLTIQSEQLNRIELQTRATKAFLRTASGVTGLPIGSRLQRDGTFTWQPGVGFIGAYDFVFQTPQGQQSVRIVLNPRGIRRVGPQVVIDAPAAHQVVPGSFIVGGWAADHDAVEWTGIDLIHIWAYPATGADPIFLGSATLGGIRPDVAAAFGERLRPSGYGLLVNDLAPGGYLLAVFGWSSATGGFLPAETVRIAVR